MPHKVLVLSQGPMLRWNTAPNKPYLDIPKHLLIVDGETLLDRTRRLFTNAGCEVVVIGPQKKGYKPCVTLDDPHPTGTNQDKFLGCVDLWSKDSRTIIVWGDCFLTEEAVDKIASHRSDALHYFRRIGPSRVSGHKWDESFAVSFGPKEHERVLRLATYVAKRVKAGNPPVDHIRTHYAASMGLTNLDEIVGLRHTPGQTNIHDWSDDFDNPEETTKWLGRYYERKINVAVCIPWRDGNEARLKSRDFIHHFYSDLGVPVYYGTSAGRFLNRSAARNAAVKGALLENPNLQVLFFADSDTLITKDQFWSSCYLAMVYNTLTLAFSEYHRLDKTQTKLVYKTGKQQVGKIYKLHASGALAVSLPLWKSVGGYDERFKSWGAEDRAFFCACNTIINRSHSLYVIGKAIHLFHGRSIDKDSGLKEYLDNVELGIRYKLAAGKPNLVRNKSLLPQHPSLKPNREAMFSILKEEGAPLNPRKPQGTPLFLNIKRESDQK